MLSLEEQIQQTKCLKRTKKETKKRTFFKSRLKGMPYDCPTYCIFLRKICRNCKCKQEDHDVLSSVSTRGINNIGKLLMQDREAAQRKPPSSDSTGTNYAKPAAPPPAPKPIKQSEDPGTDFSHPTHKDVNGAAVSSNSAGGALNITIDIGGKKHALDFGTAIAAEQAMPPPPPPEPEDLTNYSGYAKTQERSQENDFVPPPPLPPPPEHDQLPEAPPLPEEFAEKTVIAESYEHKTEVPPTKMQSKSETPAPVRSAISVHRY